MIKWWKDYWPVGLMGLMTLAGVVHAVYVTTWTHRVSIKGDNPVLISVSHVPDMEHINRTQTSFGTDLTTIKVQYRDREDYERARKFLMSDDFVKIGRNK